MHAPLPRIVTVAASLVALVALSSCGSSDDSPSPTTSPTPTPSITGSPSSPPPVVGDPAPTAASRRCAAGTRCSTAPVVLNGVTLTVAAAASNGQQRVSAELAGSEPLHCGTAFTSSAPTAIFSSTAPDAGKTVTYVATGAAANAIKQAYAAHPEYLGCYGSPKGFIGYVDGGQGPAVKNSTDNLFEAALLPCDSVSTKPCFSYSAAGGTVTVIVTAPPGDPRFTP